MNEQNNDTFLNYLRKTVPKVISLSVCLIFHDVSYFRSFFLLANVLNVVFCHFNYLGVLSRYQNIVIKPTSIVEKNSTQHL